MPALPTRVGKNPPGRPPESGTLRSRPGLARPMAEGYAGLVGAYAYALRSSRSWLFRTYVVASAAVGLYVAVLLVLAVISWAASPIAFGEKAFLAVLGLFVVVPLATPVLIVARRHRRHDHPPASDHWLALAGYGFVASVALALFVSDPSVHAVEGGFAPIAAWLDGLPDVYGLVLPVVAAVLIVVVARWTRSRAA